MKRKLISFLLTLALAGTLASPALALETPPAKYPDFQQYLDFYRTCTDAETQELTAYIDAQLAEGLLETFDADAWFEANISADPLLGVTKENWFAQNGPGYGEDHFRAEMLNVFLVQSYWTWHNSTTGAELAQRWPEEYAAFDAEAWFAGYYGSLGVTSEYYRTFEGLDAEGFKLHMFADWAGQKRCFFNGICVMVNGTPVQFQLYWDLDGEIAAPKTENDRILIPVRAAAEALGLTVEYLPETNRITCTGEAGSVWFILNRTDYSGGTLDAAPYAENGITYLPLRALGEALGCTVAWNQAFSTAALTSAP